MSKAFTRESDDLPERPALARPLSALPPGATNYLTLDGAERFRAELEQLVQVERPRLMALHDDTDAAEKLRAAEQRILQLEHCLRTAVVVPPATAPDDRVRFGTTVTVRDRGGEETTYRIVGADEADVDRDWVSWLSPIARALNNARLEQRVRFKFPAGERELEIIHISHEPPR